jgi:phosphoglycerate dehydrogenase-like enzyme
MKILLHGAVPRQGMELLRRHFGDAVTLMPVDEGDRTDAARRCFAEAEAAITSGFDADTPAVPRLRLIQLPGAGIDAVDLAAVPAGCTVCNVFEHEIGISEYVFAAILHFVVDLADRDARFRAGSWRDGPSMGAAFRPELAGQTIGCVGYGHIGRAVGRRARAFGMRVMAITGSSEPLDPAPDWLGHADQLDALLEAADFVLIACPLTEATRGLIGRPQLGCMKPNAVLINVARGPIVDQDALFEALRERTIAGAAIDTWYHYPSPEWPDVRPSRLPFQELDNLVMTPHCSGWTEHLMERRFALIAENLERLRDGRPLLNQVHPA